MFLPNLFSFLSSLKSLWFNTSLQSILSWEDTPCSLHDVLLVTEGECNCPPPELNFQILPPEGQKLLEWIEQGNIILLKLNIYL